MRKAKMDDEMKTFAVDLLESIVQTKRGDFARVHTPANIATYKERGRPVGNVSDDASKGLDDIAAGLVKDARTTLAALKRRRAAKVAY